jgi:hypothetical protein
VSLQPEIPVNDGWNEIIHDPQPHHHGWPTVSFPLPPPPPKKPLQPVVSMASHALSSQQPNKNKALAHEPEPSKGKQLAMSPSSDSSSHSVTSHSIPQKHEPRNITFGDMHPEASSNEDKKSAKEDLQTHTGWLHLRTVDRRGQPHTKNMIFNFIL